MAEGVGGGAVVERDAMLERARRAEIVADPAEREDQIIVADAVRADQLAPVFVDQRRDDHLLRARSIPSNAPRKKR